MYLILTNYRIIFFFKLLFLVSFYDLQAEKDPDTSYENIEKTLRKSVHKMPHGYQVESFTCHLQISYTKKVTRIIGYTQFNNIQYSNFLAAIELHVCYCFALIGSFSINTI